MELETLASADDFLVNLSEWWQEDMYIRNREWELETGQRFGVNMANLAKATIHMEMMSRLWKPEPEPVNTDFVMTCEEMTDRLGEVMYRARR